jgi:ectoine hydroxylase-related dioxygenase (phytanoyl-CoA dioxygenase family)
VVAETEPYFAAGDVYRVQDAWMRSAAVRRLATHPAILRRLELAYGRRPFAFQTLNFQRGTQQGVHSDAIHFHSAPERFMCGVWIALEDVTQGAGPLEFVPGSHRAPVLTMQDAGVEAARPVLSDYARAYLPALHGLLAEAAAPHSYALPKKGQALVWAANLAHGGAPIADPASTRRSLVVHVYFEDCHYYTPMVSNPAAGVYRTRLPLDVATGRWVWPRRDGRRVGVPAKAFAEAAWRRLARRPAIAYLAGSPRATNRNAS